MHSPKPWVILDLRESYEDITLPPEECLSICSWHGGIVCRIKNTVSGKPLDENDEDNARLIHAAPDMLEALELVMSHRNTDQDGNYVMWVGESTFLKVEAAIKRAKGIVDENNIKFEDFDL